MFAPNVDAVPKGDAWSVRAEVVGPRILRPDEVRLIENRLGKSTGKEVDLHVWSHVELVVTGTDYIPVEVFYQRADRQELKRNLSRFIKFKGSSFFEREIFQVGSKGKKNPENSFNPVVFCRSDCGLDLVR